MKDRKFFKNISIFFAVLILVFLVIYYFVYQDIKTKNEHISTLTRDLSSQSSRQEYLLSTQRMIDSFTPQIDKVNNSIVSSDGDVSFIESLESYAKNDGLAINIDSLVIQDKANLTDAGMTSLKITAKTSGSWSATYTFLDQIESLPFKMQIDNFSMTNNADQPPVVGQTLKGPWQGSFEIRVLKYK